MRTALMGRLAVVLAFGMVACNVDKLTGPEVAPNGEGTASRDDAPASGMSHFPCRAARNCDMTGWTFDGGGGGGGSNARGDSLNVDWALYKKRDGDSCRWKLMAEMRESAGGGRDHRVAASFGDPDGGEVEASSLGHTSGEHGSGFLCGCRESTYRYDRTFVAAWLISHNWYGGDQARVDLRWSDHSCN